MTQASQAYRRLAGCTARELERLLLAGETPSIAGIVGFRYRGFNHPQVAALLGIQKFIKSFFTGAALQVFGCNTPVVQNGLDGEWRALPDDDHPKRCLDAVLPKVTRSLRRAATALRKADDGGRVLLVGYHLVPGLEAPRSN